MPHSSLAIANVFIGRALDSGGRGLTQMQVQKLVYLGHGWSLAALDEPLIDDAVEAWQFGPVIRNIYSALSRYGNQSVERLIRWGEDTVLIDSDDDGIASEDIPEWEMSIIDIVWEIYGTYPAFKLSALTHQPDTPWSQTYRAGAKRVIPNGLIQAHFKELLAA